MTTYNPPLDLFRKQVESIINQSYKNWILIINDDCSNLSNFNEIRKIAKFDSRIQVFQNKTNFGFYYNFERCLFRIPKDIDYVAFSDQDDFWYKNKLEKLLSVFDDETKLVYSDMRIKEKNKVISNTYWTYRKNNYQRLDYLLLANTITGAASLFRKDILDFVLPFPQKIGDSYHDWWIACVALTLGKIKFVKEPLYDYHQHESNVLGHFERQTKVHSIKDFTNIKYLHKFVQQYYGVFQIDLPRIIHVVNCLKQRCPNSPPDKMRVIEEFITYESDIKKLFFRFIKSKLRKEHVTLGAEQRLFLSHIVTKIYKKYTFFKRNTYQVIERPDDHGEQLDANMIIDEIKRKIEPLNLKIISNSPKRINLLIPTIDFKYFFGGYIAKFNFALQLAKHGCDIRIIIVDWCDFKPDFWKDEIKKYAGLEDFFNKIQVEYAFDRTKVIEVNKNDVFIATTWWTAQIANKALNHIIANKFLYLIQEYEPLTFPHGTYYALANETYSFPHYAIFSTEFLREYFRTEKIGVFKNSITEGDENSISFENPILSFDINEEAIKRRKRRKLLFYARPEQHAARNMFEIGIMSIIKAINKGKLDPNKWEFFGIGSVNEYKNIKLAKGAELILIPRLSLEEYKNIMPNYDIGLSLMLTPHPNLVTLEMAAAGMIVVTNEYENKNELSLSGISSNINISKPTITSISEKLCECVELVEDLTHRVEGSKVKWSTKWQDSFNHEKMKHIVDFINKS